MVTFLLSQFASITIAYFHYPTSTKIDIIQEDININYYTVLRDISGYEVFKLFKCPLPRCDLLFRLYLYKILNANDLQLDYLNIDQILIQLIKQNITYKFNRFHKHIKPLNLLNINENVTYNQSNLLHRGYIANDIYTNIFLARFWTFNFNQTINQLRKVFLFF